MSDGVIDTTKPSGVGLVGDQFTQTRENFQQTANHIADQATAHGLAAILTSKADYEAHKANVANAHGLDATNENIADQAGEIADARGTQGDVDGRLSVFLGADGVPKLSVLQGRYIDNGDVPTFLSSISFSVPGDRTKVYLAGSIVRATVPTGYVYGIISTSVYGAVTTVTFLGDYSVLAAGLSKVEVALVDLNYATEEAVIQLGEDLVDLQAQVTALGMGLLKLASVEIDGQTVTKQTIYTVPTGKILIPVLAVFRQPSATLAGLVDLDVGGNANADDWLQEISLNAFTAITDFGYIKQAEQAAGPPIAPTKKGIYAAATVFGLKINTGSTGVATFYVDLFGYVI